MAISQGDVDLWRLIAAAVPRGGRVLELGEANWYMDAEPPAGSSSPWDAARRFYRDVLDPREVVAVDLNGTERSLRLDLNEPLPEAPPFDRPFDVVINSGTLEHVFDVRRAWQTAHDCCAAGGLMVHSAPVGGWEDHGFYTYQGCFFHDIEAANGYTPLAAVVSELSGGKQLHLAWRKGRDGPFRVPRQGRYTEEYLRKAGA